MRTMLIAALTLLAACAQPDQAPRADAGPGCERTATAERTWSNAQAPDRITARAEGPTCAQAVVTLVIRNANGDPLWAVASTYEAMNVGGRYDAPAEIPATEVEAFLASWIDVTERRSAAMPAWPEDAESLAAAGDGMAYYTEFSREGYERARERDLPLICYAAGVESSQCLIIDPATNAPAAFVALGA